eukprot:CAMPEP_0194323916 /NCGR_PEP_ID=MMETSP0171-20130528/26040_1 /TAXON_ID=218684 /ORGANISM="Corethron pennatum, Strain L29A3" /LENGTH=89 /DNA_ID=CAMNT_0039082665 /DNA_START=25 /DNA_END=292 /DNA_ORIENTATION=+
MEMNFFCPEEIRIPAGLPTVLRDFAKAAIAADPDDLVEFGAHYFREKRQDPPPQERGDGDDEKQSVTADADRTTEQSRDGTRRAMLPQE